MKNFTRLLFLFALLVVMGTSVGAEGTDVIDRNPSFVEAGYDLTVAVEADVLIINLVAPMGLHISPGVALHQGVMQSFRVIAVATKVEVADYGWQDNELVFSNEVSLRKPLTRKQFTWVPLYRITQYKYIT